jgi:hypothetical protein
MSVMTLDEQWEYFAARVLNPLMSEAQREDMETAFKGGAISLLVEQYKVTQLPVESAVAIVAGWRREATAHFAKFRAYGVNLSKFD